MKTVHEAAREIPVIREVDVLVAGAGPAGVAAALAAARNGARTLLVERFGYLGGMVTGSYITFYMGFGNGREQVVRGIAQETIDRLREVGGLTKDQDESGDCYGDAEIIKCVSVKMLADAGVEMLLHTLVAGAIVENASCKGAIVENKAGRQAIMAKVLIDATADADLCVAAGATTVNDLHDISLCKWIEGVDEDKLDAFKKAHPAEYEKLMAELERSGGKVVSKFPGLSAVDPWHLTKVENETRIQILNYYAFMRKNVPGYEKFRVRITAPQLGVRESRKMLGLYTITEDDLLEDRKFPDGVGRCGAYMKAYENYDKPGLSYDIPYGVLVSKEIDGLMAAGRCISATHGAINTLRLVVPCILTGEAAGTAAALAVKEGVPPRSVDIKALQGQLKAQGNNLG